MSWYYAEYAKFKYLHAMRRFSHQLDDDVLKRLIPSGSPVILEIGANDGTDTLRFASLFPTAQIYAFEPDPRAVEVFRSKVNNPNVFLFDTVLSDVEGEVEFYQSSGTPPDAVEGEEWHRSGSIKAPKEHLSTFPWCKFEKKIVVKSTTLDNWRKREGIKNIDFIWCDVQGAELNVIRGGIETFQKHTKYFYTEYYQKEMYENNATTLDVMRLLGNFKLAKLFKHDMLLKNSSLR